MEGVHWWRWRFALYRRRAFVSVLPINRSFSVSGPNSAKHEAVFLAVYAVNILILRRIITSKNRLLCLLPRQLRQEHCLGQMKKIGSLKQGIRANGLNATDLVVFIQFILRIRSRKGGIESYESSVMVLSLRYGLQSTRSMLEIL